MSNQTYDLLIPIFTRMLPNLKAILEKAQEDAEARKIDPQVFLQARLAPDMFALARQVQITTDQVKGGLARLAGVEVPKWDDNEKTFGELCAPSGRRQAEGKGGEGWCSRRRSRRPARA